MLYRGPAVCSKNKGADQLHSYWSATLLSHMQKSGFLMTRSTSKKLFLSGHGITNILVSDLVQHKPGCTATEDG